ncbi:MAG: hypothetical protein IK028_04900 [Bacilli bacterium]|nr:hypothetical protein [Bacilli bacterium]
MIYTTKELLDQGETEYSIRVKVSKGSLFLVERGIFSDKSIDYVDEAVICKKYPFAVLTGLSAFYFYGLTDQIPDHFYLATEQHSFPIRRDGIIQSYQDSSFFFVGIVKKEIDTGVICVYDLERMLIELIRLKEKYPPELYYEVLNSFRKMKNQLDFYKVNEYAKSFKNHYALLQRIKEVI